MTANLAIFTAQLGTVSETFIRKHVEGLLPGRTVVVARRCSAPDDGRWKASCPTLFLDRRALALPVRLARRAGWSEDSLRAGAVERFLRRHHVGMVLGEYLDLFVDFVPLLDRLAIPYIAQGHGIDVSAALRRPGMSERYRAFKSAEAILTRCEFHRQRLISLGLPAERIHVNPGGVDVPAAVPQRPPGAGKRFLAVGRMTRKKGPIYLLEAFRLAAQKEAQIALDYIGNGEMFSAAQQFVKAAGLRGRVRLHGAAPDEVKLRLFGECGTLVQHSLTDPDTGDEEGLPASIQEAMANGMAVVSTRHSGIAEAVQDGESGLLVDEGDAKGMADAMLRIAMADGLCERLGAAGRTRAAELYTWNAECARILSFLSHL